MEPVVTAVNAFPHLLLQTFISHYTYRKISMPQGALMRKTMPPRLVCSIDFFFGDSYEIFDYTTNEKMPFSRSTVRGIRTITKYNINLQNNFASFTVKFHPGGMYKLLGIPMNELTNNDTPTDDLKLLPVREIVEQLMSAQNIADCKRIVEPYLLGLLEKQKQHSYFNNNDKEFYLLLNKDADIKILSDKINLSIRQMERCFLREFGVSPQHYQSLSRFASLINLKKIDPVKTWTELSYETNYYDQSHMIKSFKSFLQTTPGRFVFENYAF